MCPLFKSEEEAVKAHESYHLDTDREGKFHSQHTGWLRTKQLLEWVPEGGKTILGVGCNSGGLEKTILQRKKGNTVYGVDVNKDLVALAVRKGVIAKVAKGEDLPFKNEFFDVVILSEVLEHVFDMENFIDESLRVLKKGGLLLGSVPHPKGGNAMKGVENHLYHTRIFTKQSLKRALVKLGNLEIKEIGFNPPDLPNFKIDRSPQWIAWRGIKKGETKK